MVNVQFAGQGTSFSFNSDRELLVTATPGAVSVTRALSHHRNERSIRLRQRLHGRRQSRCAARLHSHSDWFAHYLWAQRRLRWLSIRPRELPSWPIKGRTTSLSSVCRHARGGSRSHRLRQSLCTGALGSGSATAVLVASRLRRYRSPSITSATSLLLPTVPAIPLLLS